MSLRRGNHTNVCSMTAWPAGNRLEVPTPLAGLVPQGALRRGTVVGVGGLCDGLHQAWSALALSLIVEISNRGAWCALVGQASVGLASVVQMGVDLGRLALVPDPQPRGRRGWAWVVASLMEGCEAVVAWPPPDLAAADARRLRARIRQHHSVLVVVGNWPDSVDLRLQVVGESWEGLGEGHGLLRGRRMEVRAGGRAWGGRERSGWLWLPAAHGGLADGSQDPESSPAEVERYRHQQWRSAG